MPAVSIGVCAYNEEKNIRHTLDSLLAQTVRGSSIEEIIVVSSGSTDATDDIVKEYGSKDDRIRLLRQEKREGKNSAVNAFMAIAKGEILVIVNADNNLAQGALDKLVSRFSDPKVGVVGGRPMPVNRKDTIAGFAVHMLWDMHHRLSLIYPKVGEAIAFRNMHIQIPTGMQSDEDLVRMDLEKRGYRTEYEPEAIVINKGPETVSGLLEAAYQGQHRGALHEAALRFRHPNLGQPISVPGLPGLPEGEFFADHQNVRGDSAGIAGPGLCQHLCHSWTRATRSCGAWWNRQRR